MSELIEYENMLIKSFGKNGINSNAKKYHEWFIKNAKLYKVVNKTESKKLSKYARLKQCYNNCYKLSKRYNGLKYVEGLTLSLIPLEHAFLLNDKNEVIDPTLGIDTGFHKDRYGIEYLGIEIPQNILNVLWNENKHSYLSLPYLYWEYLNKNE